MERNIIKINPWKGNKIQAKTWISIKCTTKSLGKNTGKKVTKCNKEYYLLKDKEDYLTKVEKQTLI